MLLSKEGWIIEYENRAKKRSPGVQESARGELVIQMIYQDRSPFYRRLKWFLPSSGLTSKLRGEKLDRGAQGVIRCLTSAKARGVKIAQDVGSYETTGWISGGQRVFAGV